MKQTNHFPVRRLIILCAAVILLLSTSIICYAEDVGGIRTTIQLWILGDQTTAVMDIQNGEYKSTQLERKKSKFVSKPTAQITHLRYRLFVEGTAACVDAKRLDDPDWFRSNERMCIHILRRLRKDDSSGSCLPWIEKVSVRFEAIF